MTGREALAIQGIGLEHSMQVTNMHDRLFMKLAGDAFSIGCFLASLVAGLACSELGEEDIVEFVQGM